MMKAVSTSEMPVNFYQTTWHYIPKDSSHLLHNYEFRVTSSLSILTESCEKNVHCKFFVKTVVLRLSLRNGGFKPPVLNSCQPNFNSVVNGSKVC
jgi:hypothetical protein